MDVRGQLFVSVAALAGAVALYQYSKTKTEEQEKKDKEASELGFNPNWKHGAPIQRGDPVDTHDAHQPSCQVWDNDIQLFVNSGNKDADADQQLCWQQNNDPTKVTEVRYVDKDGKISFKTGDPFGEPAADRGNCYFITEDGQVDTFPDIFEVAPPNRSQRLCFASGTESSEKPFYFISGDGTITMGPDLTADSGKDYVDTFLQGYTPSKTLVAETDADASYCEEKIPFTNPAGKEVSAWALTQASSTFTDVGSCLSSGLDSRFRDNKQQQFIYENPFTKEQIMTPIDAVN